MRVKIDSTSARQARLINTDRENYADTRRYYLLESGGQDAIVVVRNGHSMQGLAGRVVSANVGWDTAQPGLCHDRDIGKSRTKVTVYNPVREKQEISLSGLLRREGQYKQRRRRR